MSAVRAVISGSGVISALGSGWNATREALKKQSIAIRPLNLFPTPHIPPLPSGEIRNKIEQNGLPRTHQLAQIAAAQAYDRNTKSPDAIVMGSTTGGLLTTEELLRNNVTTSAAYRYHSPATVAETIAKWCECKGPVITVSTACSSGAVVLKIALELIRSGKAHRVLAGGADSLCRLTYHGFNSLQLIDPQGARPLDHERRGMSVGEGAAFLMLDNGVARASTLALLGGGLSCDAYHPTAPHPDGTGARAAMAGALADAGLTYENIDYINLHGTGTKDNDLSEARAVGDLFKNRLPMHSSIKGATGHSLAAAGAVEAVVAAGCLQNQWIPGNVGLTTCDPALNLSPVMKATAAPVKAVLSNSLGFGGNNAAVVLGESRLGNHLTSMRTLRGTAPLTVVGSACITGAGHTDDTYRRFTSGKNCTGTLSSDQTVRYLSKKNVRRLQRLPRLTLALAQQVQVGNNVPPKVDSIFMGTGWGALSETHRFLTRLFETDEQFPSPTDFIGSVHNAPAGQAAIMLGAAGANVTTTGGDVSFEQALMTADLCCDKHHTLLLLGADEAHQYFSPLLDESVKQGEQLSDGGGALLIRPESKGGSVSIALTHYEPADERNEAINRLIQSLGTVDRIQSRFGFVLAGIPAAQRPQGDRQLTQFKELTHFSGPVIDYRPIIGEFATASAVAAVLATRLTTEGSIPPGMNTDHSKPHRLHRKGGLILGLGAWITAVEVLLQ